MPHIHVHSDYLLALGHTLELMHLLQQEGAMLTVSGYGDKFTELTGGKPTEKLSNADALLYIPSPRRNRFPLKSVMASHLFIASPSEDPELPQNIHQILPGKGEILHPGMATEVPMASPWRCAEALLQPFTKQILMGKRVLITAGPTIEDVDPARFVSNRSSGKMGTSLALMAARMGAEVLLIHGPMAAPVPPSPKIQDIPVRSACEMHIAVMQFVQKCDVAILCAAVADFQPIEYSDNKLKKGSSDTFTLLMRKTPDILASVGALKKHPFLVGFAAESQDIMRNALKKLTEKHCDMLCANDILAPNCGFAVGTNSLTVFEKDHQQTLIPLAAKRKVASQLLSMIADRLSR